MPSNFMEGTEAWVKMSHRNWVNGKVLKHPETPYSFIVKLADGGVFRRNQPFSKIKKTAVSPKELSCKQPNVPFVNSTATCNAPSSGASLMHRVGSPLVVQGKTLAPLALIQSPRGGEFQNHQLVMVKISMTKSDLGY